MGTGYWFFDVTTVPGRDRIFSPEPSG